MHAQRSVRQIHFSLWVDLFGDLAQRAGRGLSGPRQAEKVDPALKSERTKKRRASRNDKLDHLPHEEVVIEQESKVCPCCNETLHVIGEDVPRWHRRLILHPL